jgi:2-haloacid dehalogenase
VVDEDACIVTIYLLKNTTVHQSHDPGILQTPTPAKRSAARARSMPARKHVVWDIVGTCVSYDAPVRTVTALLGSVLSKHGISPAAFVHLLNETAEREYTFLSISNAYTPYFTCMRRLFYRVLRSAGVPDPREVVGESDVDAVMDSFAHLEVRPGVEECWKRLRAEGFTMWAFTAGDASSVQGMLEKGGVVLPVEQFRSCDSTGVGKPSSESYRPLLQELRADADGEDVETWFAAAHQWDVSAAKRSGFDRGAYVTVLEGEAVDELFGKMDVTAGSFEELAEGIITVSKEGAGRSEGGD